MTKRDLALIANVIHNLPAHSESLRAFRTSCAYAFADALPQTNPRFDRERFLTACIGANE